MIQVADLAIGSITITAARSEAVDFSIPYSEEKIGLVSQIPFALPKWKAMFWPFEYSLWLAIVLSFLLFGTFYHLYLSMTNDGVGLDWLSCTGQAAITLCMQRKTH